MQYKSFADRVVLPTKRDVLRIHLYLKLLQFSIKPYENDIDIILDLYLCGGYTNSEQQAAFIQSCLEKKLRKSDQSVRNALSKYVTLGVFNKPKNTVLSIDDRFIPSVKFDKLLLQHIVGHAE